MSFSNPRRYTEEDISILRATSWEDLDTELVTAYKDTVEGYPAVTETEKNKIEEQWNSFLEEYKEHRQKKMQEIHGDWVNEKIENEENGFEELKINAFDIGLPSDVSELTRGAEEDPFYHLPTRVRELVIHHRYVLEIVSYYAPLYMIQPTKNVFVSLDFVIEEAKSCGLFYRKMYCVNANYAIIFCNFTDRTDEVMIEDYKKNKAIVMQSEAKEMEEKISEIEAANFDIIEELQPKEFFGESVVLEEEFANTIKITECNTSIDPDDVKSYIYSTFTVALIYTLKPETVIEFMKKRTVVVIRHEKFSEMQCKFHNLYFLPSC